ncbi:hypothetical protein [Bradyrhizobium sp. McL0615]|uniref:hypothetical protein n=1 Tax=Bradyrhizobium sp. McL0615 TaxID=3415673 RepID=UPI003CE71F1F
MSDKVTNESIVEAMAGFERDRLRHLAAAEELARKTAEHAQLLELAAKHNYVLIPTETARPRLETISDLIKAYRTVETSPYHKLSHASQTHYDALLGLIENDHGNDALASLRGEHLNEWHQAWSEGGKKSVAHAKIGMVRGLFGFGNAMLHDPKCEQLFGILAKLRFKAPKARVERLTPEDANAIRMMARRVKRPSIALAQAFQTDAGLLQKDTIGEWVPVSADGVSDIMFKDHKWVRGIRWNEIDDNLVLRHAGDGWQGDIEFPLLNAPAVLEEFRIQFDFTPGKDARSKLPASGAIVRRENDNLPWDAVEFRRHWRICADHCKIPKTVRNADSRPRAKESVQKADEAVKEQRATK